MSIVKYIKCRECGETKRYYAKGMCSNCYNKQNIVPSKICIDCGEFKPHAAKGRCRPCYRKYDRRVKKDIYHEKSLIRRRKDGQLPMAKNKLCSSFLGVHVAEQVLDKVFKNVESMPYGHPSYDFICNKGMKIDVKSACTNTYNGWLFHIKNNIIADYFLLLAFDNREDLNPLHIWQVPSNTVNHLDTLRISIGTIDKWNEHELDITKIVNCCDTMRN